MLLFKDFAYGKTGCIRKLVGFPHAYIEMYWLHAIWRLWTRNARTGKVSEMGPQRDDVSLLVQHTILSRVRLAAKPPSLWHCRVLGPPAACIQYQTDMAQARLASAHHLRGCQ